MKSSIRSRSMKLLGLAAKVSGREFTQTVKEQFQRGVDEVTSGRLKTRLEQAKLIADNLSQLKGAAMKAGQMLSLDAADFFPPEAIEILSKLQGKAEPVDWALLRGILEEDLGDDKISDFENLSILPTASASIGQVHRAKLNGEDVAIKIQYPGVRESIDSDLKILRTIAQGFLKVTGRKIELDELFRELGDVLHQEADYEIERDNMIRYKALLKGDPDFIVPEPIASHSSKRVLTMTWQEGSTLNDWLKTSPSHDDRAKIGRLLLDLYCKEFFEWGFVQTDPNYGNFLIRTTGEHAPRLVVLDFGATLSYTTEFRANYVRLLKAMGSFEQKQIVDAFVDFGLLDVRESEESREALTKMMILSLEPFQKNKQPFRFKDDDYSRRTREATQAFTQSLKFTPPPKKILFLHRKLGGVFAFLKKLDIQIDVTPYWKQMVESDLSVM